MRRLIVWLFFALVITVPFAFTSVNEELFEFNKMLLVYAFAALIAGTWAIRMVREKRLIFEKTPLLIPLALFLLSQILSTFTSIHPATSVFGYYSRFHGGLLSTLSYLLLYFAAVSNLRRSDLRPLLSATVFAGIGAALYALPEHFGVSPSCVLITGEFSVSCWVQDVQTRVFGTFGQPNWLAAYLLILMPLALWLWHTGRSTWERWLSAAAFPLFFAVLLFTGSRSGFLGLIAGAGIFLTHLVWSNRRRLKRSLLSSIRTALAVTIGSIGLLSLVFGTPFTPSLSEFWASRQPAQSVSPAPAPSPEAAPPSGTVLDSGGTNSGEIRRIVWKGALAVWRRYPIFGSGVETFAYSYYQDRPLEHNLVSEWDFLYNKAHNEFVNALATTGAVGLSALLVLMGAFVFQLWRRPSLLSSALLAGYVALAVSNFFGFSTVMVALLFFLMPSWLFLEGKKSTDNETAGTAKTMIRARQTSADLELELDTSVIFQAAIGFAALVGVWLVFRAWDNDRLLAAAKRQSALGQPTEAYQLYRSLTTRAPNEALFWDEDALFLAGLAAAAAPTDATLAAQLSNEAAAATDRAIALNPVHLSYWKSRAKVYLYLAQLNPEFYALSLEAMGQAARLAPTDPKIWFNQAMLFDNLGRTEEARAAFEKALELKPNYPQAIAEYDKFRQKLASESARPR